MMKLRTGPPAPGWGPPSHEGRPTRSMPLLLDPPLLDVPDRAERARLEVLQRLLRDGKHVVRVAEVVRLVLVEDLVERLVLLLAGRDRAVPIRWVPGLFDGLVHRRVLEEREAEALDLLGRVGDLARVPDLVRVGLGAERPSDDRRLEGRVTCGQLGHEALERLRGGLRVDAELLVLLGRDRR